MIKIGIGVDIVDNSRIKKLINDKAFISRIFSTEEIFKSKNIKDKTGYYSKKFAAKEAFSKALGTGFRNDLNFKDISIFSDKYGKPLIRINNKIETIFKKIFKTKKITTLLSMSDEDKYSIAFVVLEKK